ncbi:MAG: signal recognition particle-docking protein FtsY [Nanoarchaeota archaeon]|nr:MAG: signal recognition particle-docking protein FtsY [Nanoarchaeota archaeon]
MFGKKEEKKEYIPEKTEEIKPVEEKPVVEVIEEKKEPEHKEEKKGFFGGIVQKFTHLELSDKKFEELFWDLEVTLLENNVAVEVIDKIKADLKKSLVGVPIRKSEINNKIVDSLRKSIEELFDVPALNVVDKIKEKKPFIILFLGINGAGKTTTIAKFAHMLKGLGYKVVVAAGDTFRAAAIQQLETHANTIGVKIIKHDYGSDAAAVAFDAIAYAKSKEIDVVLIDTAGRLHSNVNLMDELKKIVRVSNPDMKIFIGESITGNDCVEQAKQFNEAIGIDGIILSKADVDEKGGAAISVSYVTGKPILYLGVGQNYSDLQEFNKKTVIEGLGLA